MLAVRNRVGFKATKCREDCNTGDVLSSKDGILNILTIKGGEKAGVN